MISISLVHVRVDEFLDRYPELRNLDRSFLNKFQQRNFVILRQAESAVISRFGTISDRNGAFRAR